MSIIDEPLPDEQAAADALAEAIDGPEIPIGVDPEALGPAVLLATHDGFELSDDRFDALRERLGDTLDAPAPKRRRWPIWAVPTLAAAGLGLAVLPMMSRTQAPESAAERPMPLAEIAAPVIPAPVVAPVVEPVTTLPSATLVDLQGRVVRGEAKAEADYAAALAEHRTRLLVAMGADR